MYGQEEIVGGGRKKIARAALKLIAKHIHDIER